MTVISGLLTKETGLGGYASDPNITDDFRLFSGTGWPAAGRKSSDIVSGACVSNLPVEANPRTITGFKCSAYVDDFYYRTHVVPQSIDAGNVVTTKNITVRVWNAHLTSKTLSAINIVNDDGINVSGAVAPTTYTPLMEQAYTISIGNIGPSQIRASIAFDFASAGDDRSIPITGSRVTAWTYRPDWSRGFLERLEWLTDVLTSYDGTEQRVALRQTPRRSFEFEFTADTAKARRKLEALLWSWGALTWACPVWTDGSRLSSGLAAGSSSIAIATTNLDYYAGGLAMILTDSDTFEIVEIQALSSGSLTLARPTDKTWPSSAYIYPVRVGYLEEKQRLSRFNGDIATGIVRFSLIDTTTHPAASETTYRSYPVLELPPVWSRDLTTDYVRKLEAIDFGTGKFSQEDEAGIPFTIQSHHWTLTTKALVDSFRSFLFSRKGKARALWVPSFMPDLNVAAQITSVATTIDVEHCFYTQYVRPANENRQDIRIKLRNGSIYYRRITGSSEVSSTVERLTIDSALGVTVNPEDIEIVSFMAFGRLDSDSVELSWWTDSVAEVTANFRSCRNGV